MNIEKLEVTTYKNYKVICEVLGVETKRQEKKLFGKRPRSPEYVLLEEEQIGKAHNLVDCSHKHLSREEHKEAQKLLCYCKH